MLEVKARRGWIAIAPLALAAVYFGVGVLWWRSSEDQGLAAYDFYGQFYPLAVHAWRALREGSGIFWNPYQSCGQPLFAATVMHVGPLNPANLVFLFLERETAVIASVILNLTLAGAGTFALCRTLGMGRSAGLCAALAFQLGWSATTLASWGPSHFAPYAWLPIVMWRAEHLVRGPGARNTVLLTIAVALQLLGGFPEIVFFTYQLIALRFAWTLLLRQSAEGRALLFWGAVGLVLPVLLTAVDLLPGLGMVRESLRSKSLIEQLGPGFTWQLLRRFGAAHFGAGHALIGLFALLAVTSARRLRRWQAVGFYVLVAGLYLVLSLGPGSPLFDLYSMFPLGNSFRDSKRLLWVVGFAMAILTGFGADALLDTDDKSGRARRLGWLIAAALGTTATPYLLGRFDLRAVDAMMILPLLAVASLPRRLPHQHFVPALLLLTIFFHYVLAAPPPLFGLRRGDVYDTHVQAFSFVRNRLTPQDRILIVGGHPDLALMPKSATLFRLPNIHDYEGLGSRRYAEFFTYLRLGRKMERLDEWYWTFGKLLQPTLQRPLFDLTAARYVVVGAPFDRTAEVFHPGLKLLLDGDEVRVYENELALPRARYVPRVVVKAENEVLPALASGEVDARNAAIVDRAPASGFTGSAGTATGTVDVLENAAEQMLLRVRAAQPGFLFLADQDYPGWTATVNGQEQEILRANYAFRLVEVPAGESDVVFAYRPPGLRIGAVLSVLALVTLIVLWRRGGRRQ